MPLMFSACFVFRIRVQLIMTWDMTVYFFQEKRLKPVVSCQLLLHQLRPYLGSLVVQQVPGKQRRKETKSRTVEWINIHMPLPSLGFHYSRSQETSHLKHCSKLKLVALTWMVPKGREEEFKNSYNCIPFLQPEAEATFSSALMLLHQLNYYF